MSHNSKLNEDNVFIIDKPYPPEYSKRDESAVPEKKRQKKKQKTIPKEKQKTTPKEKQETTPKEKAPTTIRDDVEIDRNDLDAQIKRCEERVEAGYAKKAFECKLKGLEAAKAEQIKLQSQYPGKSEEVIQRLETLKEIQSHIEEEGDPCKELVNVKAIIAAYNSDKLQWDGRATFWCQGKKIAGPLEFTWDDFAKFNTEENRAGGGFWVEGFGSPGPETLAAAMQYKVDNSSHPNGLTRVNFLIRLFQGSSFISKTDIAGIPYPQAEYQFLDDTGSSIMTIYEDDMLTLMGSDTREYEPPWTQLLGYNSAMLADGSRVSMKNLAMEVKIVGNHNGTTGCLREKWTKITCAVLNHLSTSPRAPRHRVSGNWMRNVHYVGSAPVVPRPTYVTENKEDLVQNLDVIAVDDIAEPYFKVPPVGVQWNRKEPALSLRDGAYMIPSPDHEVQGKTI